MSHSLHAGGGCDQKQGAKLGAEKIPSCHNVATSYPQIQAVKSFNWPRHKTSPLEKPTFIWEATLASQNPSPWFCIFVFTDHNSNKTPQRPFLGKCWLAYELIYWLLIIFDMPSPFPGTSVGYMFSLCPLGFFHFLSLWRWVLMLHFANLTKPVYTGICCS